MLKLSVKYAIPCGFFLISLFFLSLYLGPHPLIDLKQLMIDLVIFGVFIFFACKEYKAYRYNNALHFWQGMSVGFLVYFLATLVYVLGLIFYFVLEEQALLSYQQAATDFIQQRGDIYREEFGNEGFRNQLDQILSVSPGYLIFGAGLKKILAGLFVTPLISIILRKTT